MTDDLARAACALHGVLPSATSQEDRCKAFLEMYISSPHGNGWGVVSEAGGISCPPRLLQLKRWQVAIRQSMVEACDPASVDSMRWARLLSIHNKLTVRIIGWSRMAEVYA